MSKVVAAFGWIIAGHGGANCVPQDLPCATAGLAQDRLQLRKRQLSDSGISAETRVARRRLRSLGQNDRLPVGREGHQPARCRPRSGLKHGWRGEACHAQRPEKRRGVPAAIRRVVGDPGAGQPAAIAANQIGPHTTLIEKHEARGIERRRRGAPGRAGEADVSAIVFRRVYRFF